MTATAPAPRIKLTFAAVFWGGAFVAGKVAMVHLPPVTTAFWRFALGTAVLAAVWARSEGAPSLPRRGRDWLGLAALGVLGVFAYNWLFFKGLALADAGSAALVITTNPALTAVLSVLLFGERLSPGKAVGFGLAAAGALVVLSGADPERLLALRLGAGAGYLGGAVLCWVGYVLAGKVVMRGLSPLTATAASFGFGLPLLGVAALAEGPPSAAFQAPPSAWLAIAFMGVFSSAVAFVWFYEGVRSLGASRASVFIYLVPGFAVLFAHLVLGEAVTLPKVLGGAMVLFGVGLTSGWRPVSRPTGL